jgi:hypothetical protein
LRVTASKVALLSYCQAFAREDMKWEYTSSPAAERGTRFHKAIALYTACNKGIPLKVEDDIAAEFEHAKAWVDALPNDGLFAFHVETAFAWDPESDKCEMLDVVDRAYKPTSRLCGTADLVLWHAESESLQVYDWKTGSGENSGPQLRALGLMAARAFGVEHVTVSALEVRAGGVTEVAREELDGFALAGIAGELSEMIAAIPTSEPTPGSHCGELYCPARLHCPLGATAMAEVVDVIPADKLVRRDAFKISDPVRTAEQAMWTVDVLRLMSAWIDAKKDEIKAAVPADGWRSDDGRVLKETSATVEALDKAKALALCKQLGATDEQLGGLYYTFSKSNGLRVSGGATKPRAKRSKAA